MRRFELSTTLCGGIIVSTLVVCFSSGAFAQDEAPTMSAEHETTALQIARDSAMARVLVGTDVAAQAATNVWRGETSSDIAHLRAIDAVRRRIVAPWLERLWLLKLEEQQDAARHDPHLRTALLELAPGWAGARALLRDADAQHVEDALAAGQYNEAVSRAHDLMYDFGFTDENRELLTDARRARLEAVLAGDTETTTDSVLTAWQDAVALESMGYQRNEEPLAELIELFFIASDEEGGVSQAETFTRLVESWASGSDRNNAEALAGRANYLTAARYWTEYGMMMPLSGWRRLDSFLEQAEDYGYTEDPLNLERQVGLARASPAAIPVSLIALLATIALLHSKWRRRWRGRYLLRIAERLRTQARWSEAAVKYFDAYKAIEGITLLNRRDQLALIRAYEGLLKDALERGDPADGARWIDRMADLPFEFWPDGFEQMARLCGIDLQDRVKNLLKSNP